MHNNLVEHVKNLALFPTKKTVVLALSGGVDSMVLFDVLKQCQLNLVIAHVNHQKRKASDIEYEAIKKIAKQEGFPFEGHVILNPIESNFQEKARDIRLHFFKEVALKYQTDTIVLGHHLDDQIETFIMRFLKGTPLPNLKGLSLVTSFDNFKLVRPFISLSKDVLVDYAQSHDINYYEDSSNKELYYTRNRVRETLLTPLKTLIDDYYLSFQKTIARFDSMHELIETTTNHYLELWQETVPIKDFLELNAIIQEHFIRKRLNYFTGFTQDLSQNLIYHLLSLLKSHESNLVYPINKTLDFYIEYGYFKLIEHHKHESTFLRITKAGQYKTEGGTTYLVTHAKSNHISSKNVELWYNDKVFPLYIRNRKDGDKIKLSFGHKKIKDLFIDKKIPPSKRDEIILVTNDEEVLWIPSLKIAKFQEKGTHCVYIYEVN